MGYKYVAYDTSGKVVQGTMRGTSEALVKETLRQWGYDLLSLRPAKDRMGLRRQLPTLFRVKAQDVITFSRLLATLVEKGTHTLMALQLIRDETSNPIFRETLSDILEDVRHGRSLCEAMSQHPAAFPPIYCRMIKVSEQTGNLEAALRQVADYMEKESVLLSKVARALAYPTFVMLIASGVIVLLVTFVIPSFAGLFAEFESQIPLPTRLLIALSAFASQHKLFLLILFIIGTVLGVGVTKHPVTRRRLDLLMLKLPVLGPVSSWSEMARFSRVLAMGLRESLPMPDILEMTIQISRNRIIGENLVRVRNEILEGRSLSYSLAASPVFPRLSNSANRPGIWKQH